MEFGLANKIIVLIFSLMSLCVLGCDNKQDNALVTFDGGVLTTEDVTAHRESMKQMKEFRNHKERLTPEFVYEHALNMEMIIAKGLAMKLHQDPRIREHLHQQMSETFLKLIGEQLVPPIDRNTITDEEALKYYEEHKEKYQDKPRYKFHAFSVVPEKLEEVKSAFAAGAAYGDIAAKYGRTPKERESRGYTGTRALSRFQPSWQKVVDSLKIGEMSGPIELDGKQFFLLLESKSPMRQYSFDEKKEYIRNDVLYDKYRTQWDTVYDDLRTDFKVKPNQQALNNFIEKYSDESK